MNTSTKETSKLAQALCIRPSYTWPLQNRNVHCQQQQCLDEGFVQTGSADVQVAALFSGCGQDATRAAVAASDIMAQRTASLLDNTEQLDPSIIEAAFQHCHEQLVKLHNPHTKQHSSSSSPDDSRLDTSCSGCSALLLAVDQSQQRLIVASSGLCRAILARTSPSRDLTVIELAPYLALGHDSTEAARLDAAGSSICYVSTAAAHTASFNSSSVSSHGSITQPAAVLIGADGIPLPGVQASRLLGFTAAAAAGVIPGPVVTSWRLTGQESFIVIGSPGLWAAMTPAEVVDYVAAALGAGIGSTTIAAVAAGGDAVDTAAAAVAAVSVGDLLTLEAQERLKLKLMDRMFGVCAGAAGSNSSGCNAGVVPDVSAVVLLLNDNTSAAAAAHKLSPNHQAMQRELARVTRSCHSNAEALALQQSWRTPTGFHPDSTTAGPPTPALSALLPALTVAGGIWPAALWPTAHSITVPAVPTTIPAAPAAAAARSSNQSESDTSTGQLSFEEAAEAAGLLSSSSGSRKAGSNRLAARCGFTLSSRLSCELDLSHDHASHGSCGCLAGECEAACPGSPSEQFMIMHKVRLSGPCELESLLFGSATTSQPDTTVARILKPQSALVHGTSAFGGVSCYNAFGMNRTYSQAAMRQQQQGLPRRSASVLIAALERNHAYGDQQVSYSSINNSGDWVSSSRSPHIGSLPGCYSNVSGSSSLQYSPSGRLTRHLGYQQSEQTGFVKKARSYQALSALQAADAAAGSVKTGEVSLHSNEPDISLIVPDSSSSTAAAAVHTDKQSPVQSASQSSIGNSQNAGYAAAPFRSPFMQQRAMSAAPAQDSYFASHQSQYAAWAAGHSTDLPAAPAGLNAEHKPPAAGVTAMSMPLSCPSESLSAEVSLHGELSQMSEGRVRGGLLESSRQSSMRVAGEAAAADVAFADCIAAEASQANAAAAAADDDCADHDTTAECTLCEGKVRHGVPRDRRRSFRAAMQHETAAAGADDDSTHDTRSRSSSSSEQQQQQTVLDPLISAFALAAMQPPTVLDASTHTASSSSSSKDIKQAAAAAVLCGPVSSAAAAAAASEGISLSLPAGHLKPESCVHGGRSRAASRLRSVFSSPELPSLAASCAAADAAYEASKLQAFRLAAAAAADVTGSSSSSWGIRGVSAFAAAAAAASGGTSGTAAVGDNALESSCIPIAAVGNASSDGAVHGGALGDESLEGQVHFGRRSNSMSASCQLLSLSHSLSLADEPDLAAAAAHSSSNNIMAAAAEVIPGQSGASFSHWQQQQQQQQVAAVGQTAAVSPSMEVLSMPSGSFVKIRLSASAPAAAAAAGDGSSRDLSGSVTDDPTQLLLSPNSSGGNNAGHTASKCWSPGQQQQRYGTLSPSQAAAAAAGYGVQGPYDSVQRDRYAGLPRRSASASAAGCAFAAGNQPGSSGSSWSSSRAWSSGSSRRSTIQFGKVQLIPPQSSPAAAALPRLDIPNALSPMQTGPMADAVITAAAAAAAAAVVSPVLSSPSVRRQRSQPLPTLKETPTPGSSPQVSAGSNTASSTTLDLVNIRDRDNAHLQWQQQQVLQQQIGLILTGDDHHHDGFADQQQQQRSESRSDSSLMSHPGSDGSTGRPLDFPTPGGSLTDLLLHDVENDDQSDDQIQSPPASPISNQRRRGTSFEFTRHLIADKECSCSPALVSIMQDAQRQQ